MAFLRKKSKLYDFLLFVYISCGYDYVAQFKLFHIRYFKENKSELSHELYKY